MKQNWIKRNIFVLVIIIAVIIVLAILATANKSIMAPGESGKLAQSPQELAPENLPHPEIIKFPRDAIPQYFPARMYLEKDAQIIDNYTSIYPEGRVLAVRSYQTKSSLAVLKTNYQNYFKSLTGWQVHSDLREEEGKFFMSADGPDGSALLAIRTPVRDIRIVQITFVTWLPPKF